MIDYQKKLISEMNVEELLEYKAEILDVIKNDVGHAEDHIKSVEYGVRLLSMTTERLKKLIESEEKHNG